MELLKLERKKNTINNIYWGYFYRILTTILPFVFRKVVINFMGAEYLGVNSLFVSILNVLNMTELGFGSVIVVYMYKPVAEKNSEELCKILNFYNIVYKIVGGIILILGLLILPFIKFFISSDCPSDINIYIVYCIFLCDTVVSYFFFAYRASLFSAYQKNDVLSKILSITSVVRYIYAILVIILYKNYYLYLIILPITTVVSNFLAYYLSLRTFQDIRCRGKVDRAFVDSVKSDVVGLLAHKISGTLTFSADTVVISRFLGFLVLAKYSNYSTIMDSLFSVILVLFDSTIAGIGNSYQTESIEKNNRDYDKMFFINFWIAAWSSVCLLCLFQDFIIFWVGVNMTFSMFTVVLMSLYFYLRIIRKTLHTYAHALGLWRINAKQPIVSTLVNICLNIFLVKILGLNGVIISTILSFALIDVPWETLVVYKRITGASVRNYVIKWMEYFFEYILGAVVTFWGCAGVNTGIILLDLVIKGVICLIVPNAILLAINHRNAHYKELKFLVADMLKRVFNR